MQQVEHALRLGYLRPGDRLPKVREVVADLAINPNTVLKAYRDLERKGMASGRPGQGTFVDGSLGQARTVLDGIPAGSLAALAGIAYVRPVPGWNLGWVAWPRYRSTLAAAVAVVAVLTAYLVFDGLRTRSAYAAFLARTPKQSPACEFCGGSFRDTYGQNGLPRAVIVFLPGVVGAFAGASVLARELETGTSRYAWTQGVGRMRWTLAMLVPGVLGVAAMMGAFGALVAWHDALLADGEIAPRLRPTGFAVSGVAIIGWAVLGFALAVLAGLLRRRVVPELVTALAAWFGLALLTATSLRQSYLESLRTTSLEPPGNSIFVGQ